MDDDKTKSIELEGLAMLAGMLGLNTLGAFFVNPLFAVAVVGELVAIAIVAVTITQGFLTNW